MEAIEKQQLRENRESLENALNKGGCEMVRGNVVRCGFHDDRHPSGSIYRGPDGAWRYKCHGCKINEDVFGVIALVEGRKCGDVLRDATPAIPEMDERKRPARKWPTVAVLIESVRSWIAVEAHWTYAEPQTGCVDLVVIRTREMNRKAYMQARRLSSGEFELGGPPKPWPLYNRRRLRDDPESFVIVVEGEKCVHEMHRLGYLATTSPGGAENADKADWSPLAGRREVYIWPDNDKAGIAYAGRVREILAGLSVPPTNVYLINPARLGIAEKGDVVDYAALHADEPEAAVAGVLSASVPPRPSDKVHRLIRDTISGARYAVSWPWPLLTSVTQALLPGTITVVCGDGGSTKTFFILQSAAHWFDKGIPFAVRELEEDEDGSTLLRALAQREGKGQLTRSTWVKANADEAGEAFHRHRDFLEQFGSRVTAIPGDMPTLDELTEWVAKQVKDGCRVVVIDPITAADSEEKPWIADKRFVRNTQSILRDGKASLVLVTHPKQGRKNGIPSMDDAAGGAAYQRFTQNIFWLKRWDEQEGVECFNHGHCGWERFHADINRSVKIFKARNGEHAGLEIGYRFGPDLMFAEQGVILKAGAASPNLSRPEKRNDAA